jgi:phage terminase large subunit GpA-like protein
VDKDLKEELLNTFRDSIQLPYTDGIIKWCEQNIVLPPAYATPGKLDLSISPYLHEPLRDLDDPTIKQVNLCMATQIGKSLLTEIAIPYWVINNPGTIMKLFHNNEISDSISETRFLPLIKSCQVLAPLLTHNRHSTKLRGISFPHVSVIMKGANEGIAHGSTVKYLICSEAHQWDVGMIDKFIARTTALAGKRKIIIDSQPNEKDSELERFYLSGRVKEWFWCCPNCKTYQPYEWAKERPDGTWAGFNWDTILMPDGETTNIALSAKTCWLECDPCRHKITDTPTNRVMLNQTGKFVCVKNDGAADVVSYTAPNFVNINLTFESAASQYMLAKRVQRTGVDVPMKTFVNQVLGKFYKADELTDTSGVLKEAYSKELNEEWLLTMGVDVQMKGNIKYWTVRAYNKNGIESRRIDFGIARTWEDLAAIQNKYKIATPLVGVDSGFNPKEVYPECIRAGGNFKIIKVGNRLEHIGWTIFKGDGTHKNWLHKDGIYRLYSPPSPQDAQFTQGNKFYGIPAKLTLFASEQIQMILGNLRDNKVSGVKWLIDTDDKDYISQIYAEGFAEVLNKKTGLTENKWVVKSDHNHYFDCEKLCLTLAIMAKVFTLADTQLPVVTPLIPAPLPLAA